MKKISIYLEEYQIEALRLFTKQARTAWTSADVVRVAIDEFVPLEIQSDARAIVTKRKIAELTKANK